jgi:hypothetical protein
LVRRLPLRRYDYWSLGVSVEIRIRVGVKVGVRSRVTVRVIVRVSNLRISIGGCL